MWHAAFPHPGRACTRAQVCASNSSLAPDSGAGFRVAPGLSDELLLCFTRASMVASLVARRQAGTKPTPQRRTPGSTPQFATQHIASRCGTGCNPAALPRCADLVAFVDVGIETGWTRCSTLKRLGPARVLTSPSRSRCLFRRTLGWSRYGSPQPTNRCVAPPHLLHLAASAPSSAPWLRHIGRGGWVASTARRCGCQRRAPIVCVARRRCVSWWCGANVGAVRCVRAVT